MPAEIIRLHPQRALDREPLVLQGDIGAVGLIINGEVELWLSVEQAIELGEDLMRVAKSAQRLAEEVRR